MGAWLLQATTNIKTTNPKDLGELAKNLIPGLELPGQVTADHLPAQSR